MKFSLARPALALAVTAMLASCGGGGKATYPITVTVRNLQNLQDGPLVLSTNGMDLSFTAANPVADITQTFPNQIEYGQTYSVIPKGFVAASDATASRGAQPEHQNCSPSTDYPYNFQPSGTAGQLAKIQIYYTCSPILYPLGGTITGLTADGLTLTNGSTDGPITVAANTASFTIGTGVAFNTTYGVSVVTQPTGLTCSVTGGNGSQNNGSGIMDEAATKAGGVSSIVVTCVPKT
jgi:hypothetical protein